MKLGLKISIAVAVIVVIAIVATIRVMLTNGAQIHAVDSPIAPASSACKDAGGTCVTFDASTPRCPAGTSVDRTLQCPFTSEAKPMCCR